MFFLNRRQLFVRMKVKFAIEKREIFERSYLKVFLADQNLIEPIQKEVEKLSEVGHVNITPSQSGGVNSLTLTVYPHKCYTIGDCKSAVEGLLSSYLPNFVENKLKANAFARFQNIESQILEELRNAKALIDVCVAWFTNERLRDELLKKQKEGVQVRVIRFADGINAHSGVDLTEVPYKEVRGERKGLMHEKYCVIDNLTTITGSYNWTNHAEHRNDENIAVVRNDSTFASEHTRDFLWKWNNVQE